MAVVAACIQHNTNIVDHSTADILVFHQPSPKHWSKSRHQQMFDNISCKSSVTDWPEYSAGVVTLTAGGSKSRAIVECEESRCFVVWCFAVFWTYKRINQCLAIGKAAKKLAIVPLSGLKSVENRMQDEPACDYITAALSIYIQWWMFDYLSATRDNVVRSQISPFCCDNC